MAFLAACIGLESIFGEKPSGMTELSRRLVDRDSFMLGKDRDERGKLARDFEEVLKVRGELVHARTSRLKAKDWASPSFPDGLLSPLSLAQSRLG